MLFGYNFLPALGHELKDQSVQANVDIWARTRLSCRVKRTCTIEAALKALPSRYVLFPVKRPVVRFVANEPPILEVDCAMEGKVSMSVSRNPSKDYMLAMVDERFMEFDPKAGTKVPRPLELDFFQHTVIIKPLPLNWRLPILEQDSSRFQILHQRHRHVRRGKRFSSIIENGWNIVPASIRPSRFLPHRRISKLVQLCRSPGGASSNRYALLGNTPTRPSNSSPIVSRSTEVDEFVQSNDFTQTAATHAVTVQTDTNLSVQSNKQHGSHDSDDSDPTHQPSLVETKGDKTMFPITQTFNIPQPDLITLPERTHPVSQSPSALPSNTLKLSLDSLQNSHEKMKRGEDQNCGRDQNGMEWNASESRTTGMADQLADHNHAFSRAQNVDNILPTCPLPEDVKQLCNDSQEKIDCSKLLEKLLRCSTICTGNSENIFGGINETIDSSSLSSPSAFALHQAQYRLTILDRCLSASLCSMQHLMEGIGSYIQSITTTGRSEVTAGRMLNQFEEIFSKEAGYSSYSPTMYDNFTELLQASCVQQTQITEYANLIRDMIPSEKHELVEFVMRLGVNMSINSKAIVPLLLISLVLALESATLTATSRQLDSIWSQYFRVLSAEEVTAEFSEMKIFKNKVASFMGVSINSMVMVILPKLDFGTNRIKAVSIAGILTAFGRWACKTREVDFEKTPLAALVPLKLIESARKFPEHASTAPQSSQDSVINGPKRKYSAISSDSEGKAVDTDENEEEVEPEPGTRAWLAYHKRGLLCFYLISYLLIFINKNYFFN